MIANGPTGVVSPEQSAALQFRNDQVDEVVKSAGKIGRLNDETVGGLGREPLFHLIRDIRRRAYDGVGSARTGIAFVKLADGKLLLLGHAANRLEAAHARSGLLGNNVIGNRLIDRQSGEVSAAEVYA